jgi:hypothetical protein
VFLGDILEHVLSPLQVVEEALRVCSSLVVLTVFEEWRLPSPGLHIEAGQAASDRDSQKLGYSDRFNAQERMYPDKVPVDDTEHPHLCHIWQFEEEDIMQIISGAIQTYPADIAYYEKRFEVHHESGHDIYNWLICLEKE